MIVNANSVTIPLADESVHMAVTSPPYWGLRDYGLPPSEWPAVTYTPMAGLAPVTVPGCDPECDHVWVTELSENRLQSNLGNNGSFDEDRNSKIVTSTTEQAYCQRCGGWRGDLGLEPTPELFVAHLVAVFREVWRVLRDDGTLWLNLGDSYSGSWGNYAPGGIKGEQRPQNEGGERWERKAYDDTTRLPPTANVPALKPKDLVGIPWRVALALQADGWYLRNDIIWSKTNPMPESVTDRCTKAHEYVFLLSKSERYFYDKEAIAEPLKRPEEAFRATPAVFGGANKWEEAQKQSRLHSGNEYRGTPNGTRNRRTVWTISTRPYSGAHFATFPPDLVAPPILAGSQPGGIVLDPFCGSGTVGEVCCETGRRFVGLDLSPSYLRTLALPRAENKQTRASVAEMPLFELSREGTR